MSNRESIQIDGRLLALFCAAAEELHFGRAAERMAISQPPFSQQIKRLEQLVGTTLFTRTTRRVRLTPAGEVMHEHAKRLVADTRQMLRAVRQAGRGSGGSLVVGLAPSAACSPLAQSLFGFRKAHPGVELVLREMNSNAMETALRRRQIDVALMRPMKTDADIQHFEIFEEPMLLAVHGDHPLACRKRIRLEHVADLPLIGYSAEVSPYFRQLLQSMFNGIGRRPQIVQESVVPTVLTLVEAGVASAVVPWTLTRARGSSLAFLSLPKGRHTVARLVVAVTRDGRNPVVKNFLESLHELRPAIERSP